MTNNPTADPVMQADTNIREATLDDVHAIVELYRAVSAAGGALARAADEITLAYVTDFLLYSQYGGIALVAEAPEGGIAAEIHAHPLGPRTFAHVLGELTVAVHPTRQGRGIGRALFKELLQRVERDFPHVLRVELKSRENNSRAIALYESLGFRKEGRMEGRVRLSDGSFDADIPMAWHRSD